MATVADILSELSDHGFTDTSTARKLAVINDTIQDICSREPWPFLEKSINLNFDGSSNIPSNFPSDFRAALKLVDTVTGRVLEWSRLDDFDEAIATAAAQLTQGAPYSYYFVGDKLYVWPTPPVATGLVRMRYLLVPADVTDTTDDTALSAIFPRRHQRVITLGALWKLYDMEDDPDIAVRFQSNFEARLQTMRQDLWRKQYDKSDTVHVIDTDIDAWQNW